MTFSPAINSAAPTSPMNTARAHSPRPTASLRRILAIARVEVKLFMRTPAVWVAALFMGPGMVLVLGGMGGGDLRGAAFATYLVQMLAAWSLLFVIYFNLTTIFVARREQGVYQRLATGEATSWEAVIASSVPSAVVLLVQVIIGAIAATLAFDEVHWVNPFVLVIGLVGGIVILTGLAAWTSSFTKSVEGAQFSTMPVFIALMFASGTLVPMELLPERVQEYAQMTPLHAINDLIALGMNGQGRFGAQVSTILDSSIHAIPPMITLVAWIAIAVVAAKSAMRFDRRH